MQPHSFDANIEFVKKGLIKQMEGQGNNSADQIIERRLKKFYSQGSTINVADEHYTKRL